MTKQWRFRLPNGARFMNGPDGDCIIQFAEGWEGTILASMRNQLDYYEGKRSSEGIPHVTPTVVTVPNVEPVPPPPPPMNTPGGFLPPPPVPGTKGVVPAAFVPLSPPPVHANNAVTPVTHGQPRTTSPIRGRAFNPLMPGMGPPKGAHELAILKSQAAIPETLPPPTMPETQVPVIGDPSVQVVSASPHNHNKVEVTGYDSAGNPKYGKMSGPIVVMPQPPILPPPPIPK
jgi:hypothetical protein